MSENKINNKALYNISYGLYVVTCNDNVKDNGLIVNTVTQVASDPLRISVAINKQNYSHDVIKETKKMNVNALTTETPFSVFEKFGFQSGRDVNKFENTNVSRLENGLVVLTDNINSYMALEVEQYIDLGSHGMFICSVVEAEAKSRVSTMTYEYYQKNVKPKKEVKKETKGYVCNVCGYVYEGEVLPNDIICPLCKHGKEAFEKIGENQNTEYKKYACAICGFVYDEEKGLPSEGIKAGTKFEDLPENFHCPICMVGKENFTLQ